MKLKKMIALGLLVPALAVGVAACGSDDEESNGGTTTEMESTESGATMNIVETAQATPDLSTLVDAVVAADLVETLSAEGPYTVFAPTNEAFEALPPAELERLLKPANKDELANILTYHVVEGDVKSTDLSDGQEVETVQGGTLTVSIGEDGSVKIGDATVTQADVETSNGTVHIIDAVLLPQE